MAWIKCDKDQLVNLDKITDITINKVYIAKNNYGWAIYLYAVVYASGNNRYLTKTYYSLDECMHVFEYLTKCLESGKQYIDITDVSKNQKVKCSIV